MKTICILSFGIASVVTSIVFLILAICSYKGDKKAKRILSAIQIYTIGIFLATFLVFLPLYYTSHDFGDKYSYIRPTLLSLHNALRVFILDGDFDIIQNSVSSEPVALKVCFSLYSAILYVIAPVLTFSNVLSLSKNIKNEFRYHWHRLRKHYVFSALNEKSIALAKSIRRDQKKAVIVFTDVFEKNEEDDYELLTEAWNINAICLKKDISHINILFKRGDVELFLIGEDESENVSQAVKITTELDEKNTKKNVKIFVFSQKPSGEYIINSVKYDNLLQYSRDNGYNEKCFKLRRINEMQQLICKTVPKMNLFEIAKNNRRRLSVLILGFGSYGVEFFKTILWYCQFEGYQLQITIVDKTGCANGQKSEVETVIDRISPDLLRLNRSTLEGEAQYDIEIIHSVDIVKSDFDDLMFYEGKDTDKRRLSSRIKSTNVAFVALGDDDLNIEASVHLRALFDQAKSIKEKEDEITWDEEALDIYSIVYDDRKSEILNGGEKKLLINHREVPYHIHFIGGMSEQFDYKNVYDFDMETKAHVHHRRWVDIEETVRREWEEDNRQDKIKNNYWSYQDAQTDDAKIDAEKKYDKFEYYRLSSLAMEMHREAIRENKDLLALSTCIKENKRQTCECENCLRRKRSEHMRWNAYMRVNGYKYYKGIGSHRAKLHSDLIEWEKLPDLEKEKD